MCVCVRVCVCLINVKSLHWVSSSRLSSNAMPHNPSNPFDSKLRKFHCISPFQYPASCNPALPITFLSPCPLPRTFIVHGNAGLFLSHCLNRASKLVSTYYETKCCTDPTIRLQISEASAKPQGVRAYLGFWGTSTQVSKVKKHLCQLFDAWNKLTSLNLI